MDPEAAVPKPSSGGRGRRWLLNLHLYGGLVTCWYLVIFGVSSLHFNHRGLLPEARGARVRWERALEVPEVADNLKLAEAVRDRLSTETPAALTVADALDLWKKAPFIACALRTALQNEGPPEVAARALAAVNAQPHAVPVDADALARLQHLAAHQP